MAVARVLQVPAAMLASQPQDAPNFVRLIDWITDHYLHGLPMGASPADGPQYDVTAAEAVLDRPKGSKGRIDMLGSPGVGTQGLSGLRDDVGEWSVGLKEARHYFDMEKLRAWTERVKAAGSQGVQGGHFFP